MADFTLTGRHREDPNVRNGVVLFDTDAEAAIAYATQLDETSPYKWTVHTVGDEVPRA